MDELELAFWNAAKALAKDSGKAISSSITAEMVIPLEDGALTVPVPATFVAQ